MGKPYANDLLDRVAAATASGRSCRDVGTMYAVAPGPRGRPLLGKAPRGHWITSTFVTGLAHDGLLAPMLIDTPPLTLLRTGMTGLIFAQWLTEHLIPEMPPGRIVVCDNLPAHKVAGIRECLDDAGMGLLCLPPYSPDFNPIEQAYAKVKVLLRRAAPPIV